MRSLYPSGRFATSWSVWLPPNPASRRGSLSSPDMKPIRGLRERRRAATAASHAKQQSAPATPVTDPRGAESRILKPCCKNNCDAIGIVVHRPISLPLEMDSMAIAIISSVDGPYDDRPFRTWPSVLLLERPLVTNADIYRFCKESASEGDRQGGRSWRS